MFQQCTKILLFLDVIITTYLQGFKSQCKVTKKISDDLMLFGHQTLCNRHSVVVRSNCGIIGGQWPVGCVWDLPGTQGWEGQWH